MEANGEVGAALCEVKQGGPARFRLARIFRGMHNAYKAGEEGKSALIAVVQRLRDRETEGDEGTDGVCLCGGKEGNISTRSWRGGGATNIRVGITLPAS